MIVTQTVVAVVKHLAGQHDQHTHGKAGASQQTKLTIKRIKTAADLTSLLGTADWQQRPEDIFEMAHANNVGVIDTDVFGPNDVGHNISHLNNVLNKYGLGIRTELNTTNSMEVGLFNFTAKTDLDELEWLENNPAVTVGSLLDKNEVVNAFGSVLKTAGLQFTVHQADASEKRIGRATFFKIKNKPQFTDAEAHKRLTEYNTWTEQYAADNLRDYNRKKLWSLPLLNRLRR